MENELKPCPFCGRKPKWIKGSGTELGIIRCSGCGVEHPNHLTLKEPAFIQWNSRSGSEGKLWVVVAISCVDCGRDTAIRILGTKPTKEQLKETSDAIGGMFCINTSTAQAELDGEIIIKRWDNQ